MENLEGGETVLVVEAETFTGSVAVSMLERYGYTVLTATSGQEVLHMFEVWPDLKIDIAVIDIAMPEIEGLGLAERIRRIRPLLPILYMCPNPEKAELPQIPFVLKLFDS
jgi:CheY-like chemotaxis protein